MTKLYSCRAAGITGPKMATPRGVVGAASSSQPIPESNIGSRMLRGMGWSPGTGLGVENKGVLNEYNV